jgi:hypothetical protein
LPVRPRVGLRGPVGAGESRPSAADGEPAGGPAQASTVGSRSRRSGQRTDRPMAVPAVTRFEASARRCRIAPGFPERGRGRDVTQRRPDRALTGVARDGHRGRHTDPRLPRGFLMSCISQARDQAWAGAAGSTPDGRRGPRRGAQPALISSTRPGCGGIGRPRFPPSSAAATAHRLLLSLLPAPHGGMHASTGGCWVTVRGTEPGAGPMLSIRSRGACRSRVVTGRSATSDESGSGAAGSARAVVLPSDRRPREPRGG